MRPSHVTLCILLIAFVWTAAPSLGQSETCVQDGDTLCLQGERFLLEVNFTDFSGDPGEAQVVTEVQSADSGLFWFFDANNWEMLVKVIDGCGFNGHYWVFAAATTTVEFTLTVTDTETQTTRRYENPSGTIAVPVADVEAMPTCP